MRGARESKLEVWKKLPLVTACVVSVAAPVFVGVLKAPQLRAQSQTVPSVGPVFEVASVKPTKTSNMAVVQIYPGGRLRVTNFGLGGLIKRAFRLNGLALQENQLIGGPDWIRFEGFDIEAKAEGDASSEQLLLMLRALLVDRFKLKVHTETRELPLYALVLNRKDGRTGPDLKPSVEGECDRSLPTAPGLQAPTTGDRPRCGMFSPAGHWTGRGTILSSLAQDLSRVTGRLVVNRTGLTGTFDLDLHWTDLSALLSSGGGNSDSNVGNSPASSIPPDGTSLFTALQEQLGLKLESTRGAVDVLVIDSVERPTPN